MKIFRVMSDQCFAGMLINFRSGKFLALDMSIFLANVMLKISVDFSVTCARKIGHIECSKFVKTGVKWFFGIKLLFIITFVIFLECR